MRFALAQQNPTVGDIDGNVDALIAAYGRACAAGADVVVTAELAVTGYSPRDLLDRPSFVRDAQAGLARLARATGQTPLFVGAVVSHEGDPLASATRISNAAVVLAEGRVQACHRKILLPTYDVFDEARYFTPGREATLVTLAGRRVGLSVCEDAWNDKDYWRTPRYERDPLAEQIAAGAEILVNLSASPYDRQKPEQRRAMLVAQATRHQRPVIYVNQVGGNDSLLFDGRSVALDGTGRIALEAAAFEETLAMVDVHGGAVAATSASQAAPALPWEADVTAALVMGLADYVHKCNFQSVVLGLSGGIDSALCATLAVRALGPDHVIGVGMPSRYSSPGSVTDARELARLLGIRFDVVPIEPMFTAYVDALAAPLRDQARDVTEENLQARVRGALLMAYSNSLGALVLTTGNKSELAVGYCTLYGDMCGGLSVIGDLYKTEVYALARYLNASAPSLVIPQASIDKPPSAELRPNQTDQDTLPPYAELDAVLAAYIEETLTFDAMVARHLSPELVRRVIGMVDRSEYKRRQAAPALRVSRKAFGEGRRLPIAQRYVMR